MLKIFCGVFSTLVSECVFADFLAAIIHGEKKITFSVCVFDF